MIKIYHNISRGLQAQDIIVRCGEWEITVQDEKTHQDLDAVKITPHPDADFTRRNKIPENDFAIVHVKEDFQFSPYLDKICLPETTDDYEIEECFANGFGEVEGKLHIK